MKKIFTILFIFLGFFMINEVSAQNYESAVGLRGGWGFQGTYKKFIKESNAVEIYAGLAGYNGFNVGAMYEIHKPLEEFKIENLDWYFGGGAYAGSWGSLGFGTDNFFLGVNAVVGLDYTFKDYPINISVDVAPGFHIINPGNYSFNRINFWQSAGSIRYILGQ